MGSNTKQQQYNMLGRPFLGSCEPSYLSTPRVHDQFEALAAKHPHQPCVVTDHGQHTYGEVATAANQLAGRLKAAGLPRGTYVGVLLPRGCELVVSVMAIWKAGCVYVPMDPDFPPERLALYVQDSRAAAVLAIKSTEWAARRLVDHAGGSTKLWLLDDDDVDAKMSLQHDIEQAHDQADMYMGGSSSSGTSSSSDVAYCIFTSGSTGRPKGVQVLHIGLVDFVAYYSKILEADASMRTLMISSISFDAHCLDLVITLTCGGCLVMPKPGGHLEPHYIVQTIEQQHINTILMSVPSLVREYMAVMKRYEGMRVWLMGGEAMPLQLANQMQQIMPNLKLFNIYGPTEATICCTRYLVPRPCKAAYIGSADDNLHAYVVHEETQQLLPPGQPGELLLSGPRLGGGYCYRPDLTEKAFVPNPFFSAVTPTLPEQMRPFYQRAYRTGDLVRWTEDGLIEYLGRIDRQVKVNGVRIELGEVEAVLAEAPGVRGAVAKVLKDVNGRAMLAGYCLMPNEPEVRQAVHRFCKARLLPAMVPAVIVPMESFPLLPNGKTDVNKLPEPDWSSLAGGEFEAAANTMEQEVQAMWGQVLQLSEPISVSAEWAYVGGTSLKAIALYQMLKQHFQLPGPSAALAAASTIRGQADAVAAMLAESSADRSTAVLAPVDWRDDERPLSAGQLQMYILSEQIPLHYLYNESYALTLDGPLDVSLVEPAAAAIVDRHEVLRCMYSTDDVRGVVSRVLPLDEARPPFVRVDLSGLPEAQADARWKQLQEEYHKAPFNMAKPPLYRVMLAKLGRNRHRLQFTIHHGVMDGISMGLIAKAFEQAYHALVAASSDPRHLHQLLSCPREALPELPLQYGDYAAWQERYLAGPDAKKQLSWWKQNLAGAPELLTLPLDRPRPPVRSHEGDIYGVFLSADLADGVRRLMDYCGVTLVNLSLAAYRLTLALYAGQNDLVIGVPQSTREPGTQDLIGYFLNMIPIRCQVDLSVTPRQLLKSEQAAIQGAIAHSGVPFHEIIDVLGVARSSAHNPLIQATLTFDDDSWFPEMHLAGGVHGSEVTGSGFGFKTFVSKSDITLCVVRGEHGEIYEEFEYNTDIFDQSTIERMMGTYIAVLQAMVDAPDKPLRNLSLVSSSDKEYLLGSQWFELRPEMATGPNMVQAFEAQAAMTPDATCLVHEGATMTYSEVNAAANLLARRLAAAGVGPNIPVGLYLERGFELVLSIIAVLKARGCYVPLDPSYPADRLTMYIEDSKAAVIICQPSHESNAKAMAAASPSQPWAMVVGPDTLLAAHQGRGNTSNLATTADLDSLAYIIFTSGSTGRPKGAMLHHRGLAELVYKYNELYQLGPGAVPILLSSISFDPHVFVVLGPMVAGATLVLPHQTGHLDPEYLGRLMLDRGVDTIMSWVPSACQGFMAVPTFRQAVANLKWVGLGGEPLPLPLVVQLQQVMKHAQGVVNLYGPTEATVNSNNWIVPSKCSAMAIGKPCTNFIQYVVDPFSLSLLPVGAPGELLLVGPRVGLGYCGRDDLTRERFIANPFFSQTPPEVPEWLRPFYQRAYRTGDLCRWMPGGLIEYLGRIDRQVKVNGVRMELGEVEAALQSAPGVKLAAAKVLKDASGTATLVGYAQTSASNIPAVLQHCRSVLVPAMVPSVIVAVDHFESLPNGKLDYNKLPAVDLGGVGAAGAAGGEVVPPGSSLEQLVHDAWAEVLKVDSTISIHADFFRIGGNSLKAIIAASAIKQKLGLNHLNTPQLLQHSTIASLAAFLATASPGGGEQTGITAHSWQGPLRPPSAGQQQMYTLSSMDKTGHLYNSSAAVEYSGQVQPELLQAALDVVLARHEVLRSAFAPQPDGTLMMAVTPPKPGLLPLKLHTLPNTSSAVRDFFSPALHVRLDLRKAPMADATLLQLHGSQKHVLLLTFHHSVIDGWSSGLLMKELTTAYNALVAANWQPNNGLDATAVSAAALKHLPLQYADYAAWQQQHLSGPEAEEQLAWWKGNLAGVPELLQLPADKPRPAVWSQRGEHFEFEFAGDVVAALRAFAAHHGTTLFTTLMAAYRLLLARMSGQLDFVVGAAYQNRPAGVEDVVGYFVNTLPLRTQMSLEADFAALVASEHQALRAAMAAGDIPIADIVSAAGVARTAAYSPLVQAMMIYQDEDFVCDDRLTGVASARSIPAIGRISPMDVALMVTPQAGGRLMGLCQFNTDIFELSTMQEFVHSYTHLLQQLLQDSTAPVGSVPLLAASQRHHLLLGQQQGVMLPEHVTSPNMVVLFERVAEKQPAAPCVAFEGQEMSYGAVNAAANALARRIVSAGGVPGSSVGVLLPRCFELVVSVVAIWKAGCVYVPMDPEFPEERLAVYAEDSQASLVLVQPSMAAKAQSLLQACNSTAKVLQLDAVTGRTAAADTANLHLQHSNSDVAYCIFTSGSTGRPKGVQVPHVGLNDLTLDAHKVLDTRPGMRVLQVVSISFDPHVLDITATLTSGGCLVLPKSGGHMDPAYIAALIRQQRVTHVLACVASLSREYVAALGDYQPMKLWCMGGENMPVALVNALQQAMPDVKVVNAYGPTEAAVAATTYTCPRPCIGPMVIGRPHANVQAYVVEPGGCTLLPRGTPGELLLSGPHLAVGYFGRPDLTDKAFVPNPFFSEIRGQLPVELRPYYRRVYRTGDLVRWTAAGQLEFLGRIDRQVKVNGVRIELGEVEAALAGAPGVSGAVAKVVKDANNRACLVGYCLTSAANVSAVRSHCKRVLLPTMVPSVIVPMAQLPLLPNGKVDMDKLPMPDWAAMAAGEQYVAPAPGVQTELQQLWMKALEISEPISINADWYRLGGTSLKAIALAGAINQQFGLAGSSAELLALNTIAEQAQYVEQQLGETRQLLASASSCGIAAAGAASKALQQEQHVISPRTWDDEYRPASAGQEQMYVVSAEEGSSTYNQAGVYTVAGPLCVLTLKRAIDAFARRHEVLHAVYEPVHGGVRMRVVANVQVPMELEDFSHLPSDEAALQLKQLLIDFQARPFNLHKAPLMRFLVVKQGTVAKPLYTLMLMLHHSVMDGWSMGLLSKELSTLYAAFACGKLSSLPPQTIQYSDYAAWQREFLESANAQAKLDWWKSNLAGVPDLVQLPLDFPRPQKPSGHGGLHESYIGAAATEQIYALCDRLSCSLFHVVLAAFKVMLASYSGQQDIVVSSTFANRPAGTQDLFGYMLSILPIRSMISKESSFAQLAVAERKAVTSAMAHSDIPFQDIVSAVGVQRTSAYLPLSNVMCTLEAQDWVAPLQLYGCNTEFVIYDPEQAKNDLVLGIIPNDDRSGLTFGITYSTDILTEETVARMTANMVEVLSAAAAAPDVPIGQLQGVLAASERQLLLKDLQGECHPEYLQQPLVVDAFEAAAAKSPSAPCVVFEATTMTYAEVNAAANALARRIVSAGGVPGSSVGVLLPRSFELIVSVVAIWKAGCVYVPMDPEFPEERLAVYAEDSQAALMLVQPGKAAKAHSLLKACKSSAQVLELGAVTGRTAAADAAHISIQCSTSDVSYCIFTSGSTGRPKGVQVPHGALRDLLAQWLPEFKAGPGMRVLQVVSISFDPHVLDFTATLTSGGCLVLPKPGGHMDPAYIAALIRQQRVTHVLTSVPSVSREYLSALGPYDGMQLWLMGGESLPPALACDMQKAFPSLAGPINAYGPTEATIIASRYVCPRPMSEGNMVIGPPDHNMHAYVVDPASLTLLPLGAAGELLLSGPRLANGYFGRPDLTAKAFVDNPFFREVEQNLPAVLRPYYCRAYRTGDLVRWTAAGQLEFLGRIDRQVKVNGVRIELGEVEAALAGAPGVSGAGAKVVKDASGRAALVGYCLTSAANVSAVLAHCKRVLLPTMVPSVIVPMEAFTRLPNGKVDMDKLPDPDWAAIAAGETYQAPRNKLEQELQALWREELKISEPISITADWYRLGGTSLKAIALAGTIKQKYDLSAVSGSTDLILLTTIAEQAQFLAQHCGPSEGTNNTDDESAFSPFHMAAGSGQGAAAAAAVGVAAAAVAPKGPAVLCRVAWPDDMRPLSPGQEQMFVLSLEGNNSHYNENNLYTIVGALDLEVLQATLDGITERHEVLRGAYARVTGGVAIRIAPMVTVPLAYHDLTSQPRAQADAKAMELLRKCKDTAFDMFVPPLVRAIAVKVAVEADGSPVWKVMVVLHHAVMDGMSMGILAQEMNALYNDIHAGRTISLPPLPLQYADWAAWRNEVLASPAAAEQLDWWKQNLAGVPELLTLPTDKARPQQQSFNGASYEFELPRDVVKSVYAFMKESGFSLYHTCMTVYKVMLSMFSGQDDIVVGSTYSARPTGTENMIGYMLNMLAVRTQISPDASFKELVKAEKMALLMAMAHGDVPLARIVAALGIKRSSAYTPLIQALMTTDEMDWFPSLELPGCRPAQCDSLHTDETKSDIVLGIVPNGPDIWVGFQYSADLFDPSTIRGMADTFAAVMAAATAAPDTPLGKLPGLVGGQQRIRLLQELQGECHPEYLKAPLLHQAVEAAAAAHPTAPCLVYESAVMTYAEVNAAANQMVKRLRDAGLALGAPVGVMLNRGLHLPIALLAVLKAGGAYLPLDPHYPQDRLKLYAEAANAGIIIADPELTTRAQAMASSSAGAGAPLVISFSSDEAHSAGGSGAANLDVAVDRGSNALIIFTSGSTGTPKGVMLSHCSLVDFTQDWVARTKLGPKDVGLLTSTINFDAHMLQLWPLLVSGAKCVVPKDGGHMDMYYLADLMAQQGVTVNLFVATKLGMEWAKHPAMAKNSQRLRLWATGGELVSSDILEKVYEAFPSLTDHLVLYGPSECSVIATAYETSRDAPRGLLGRPNANTHAYVVNPATMGLVPLGAPGELVLSGPCLAEGYIGRPDLTAKAFVDNPFFREVEQNLPLRLRPYYRRAYRTGDLVRWTAAGHLEFLGRIDRQVKVNGVRIELGEVEAALTQCPGVDDAVVMGHDSAAGTKQLVAFVTPATVNTADAMEACRVKLLPAMCPSRIVAVAEFPKMPNGKINQAALLSSSAFTKPAGPPALPGTSALLPATRSRVGFLPGNKSLELVPLQSSTAVGYVGPKDDLETTIQGVWAQYLSGPDGGSISVVGDFWAEGGTSMQAGMIASELQRLLGVPLGMSDIGRLSTIRALAAHIREVTGETGTAQPKAARKLAKQPTLKEVMVRAHKAANRLRFNFPARTVRRLRERLYAIGTSSWSFTFYAIVQYVLSTLMWFVVPGCFSVAGVGLMYGLASAQGRNLNTLGLTILLLMAVYPAVLLLSTLLLIILKWVLVGRLKPGAYPVNSWTYAKWVTIHALQDQIFPLLAPFICRTSAANWLLRILGASIGRGVVIDSLSIYDWDLVSIGEGSTFDKAASMRASFVVPADSDTGRKAVLVLSWTSIGKGCKLGVFANVPAGEHLADGASVMPAMTAGQPGSVVPDSSLETMPHFLPERHQGWFGVLTASLLVLLVHTIMTAICIAIGILIALAAVQLLPNQVNNPGGNYNPFAAIAGSATASGEEVRQRLMTFSAVLIFSSFKVVACGMAILTFLFVVVWKQVFLGSLKPGVNVRSNRYKLWAYSVWRRLLLLPGMETWNMMLGNTAAGNLGLWLLGSKPGKDAFSAGLACSEPDALQLGDLMSSGGRSHASCIDNDGVVHAVKVGKAVTLGNMSLLFPGSNVGDFCIIGSCTVMEVNEQVPARSRRQGREYMGKVYLQALAEEGRANGSKDFGGDAAAGPPKQGQQRNQQNRQQKQQVVPASSHSHGGWGVGKLLGKWLFFNTQIEIQSFLLVAIWTTASSEGKWYIGLAAMPLLLVLCVLLSALWCRLLSHVLGCRSIWIQEGATREEPSTASVWSLRAGMSTGVIAPMQNAIATPYLGTPTLNFFLRIMGMKLGKRVIFLGAVPAEMPLFTLGDNVVIEAGGTAGGHYLTGQQFTYIPVTLEKNSWIQSDATLQAGCTMKEGARVLPGANVLPGHTLDPHSVWDGIPARCVEEDARCLEYTTSSAWYQGPGLQTAASAVLS